MPYISDKDGKRHDLVCGEKDPANAGELNFLVTYIVNDYLKTYGESYGTYNEIVGVLECCKLEFYRRAVAAYEDEKIVENGDVY